MSFAIRVLGVGCAFLTLTLATVSASAQCARDSECKGDRVCIDGRCVDMPEAPTAIPAARQASTPSRPAPPAQRPVPASEPIAPAARPVVPAPQPPAPSAAPTSTYPQQATSAFPSAYTSPTPNTPSSSYPAPAPYTTSSPGAPQFSAPFPSNSYFQPQTTPFSANANQPGTTRETWAMSVAAGPLFGGTLSGDHHPDIETGTTGMVRIALDGYLIPAFSMGTYLLYTRLSPNNGPDSVGLLAIGGTLKGAFGRAHSFQFRPGLALAYQRESPEGWSSMQGFGVAAIGEVAFPVGEGGLMGLAQLSFISQPVGGNDDYGLEFAPMIYLAAGLEFGR